MKAFSLPRSTWIEPLESRIAPATLVNPKTVTYFDIDGDLVTVKTSAGTFVLSTPAGGGVGDTFTLTPIGWGYEQLQLIDLSNSGFEGADLTITVAKTKPFGDGLMSVGEIKAPGRNLGKVSVAGDLGAIDAGSGSSTVPAVKSLTVRSMGLFGMASGAPDLQSDIKGALGALTVASDVKDVFVNVINGTDSTAKIGPVKIGGSLLGGLGESSGLIRGFGGVGDVTIGRDMVGGAGDESGSIFANAGGIGNVTVAGSILGGAGTSSGELFSGSGGLGAVKIGGNLHGDIGPDSGKIDVAGDLASLTVGGSIIGGAGKQDNNSDGDGDRFGQVFARGNLGAVKVAHDVRAGAGANSASIRANTIGTVTIGGSLIGDGPDSAVIRGASVGVVKIGHDVRGGSGGISSGQVTSEGAIPSLTVGGSVIGGPGDHSGQVSGQVVKIGHDVLGGAGPFSGLVGDGSTSVTIGGSLVGGSGTSSGGIDGDNSLGKVKIGKDLIGGNLAAGATGDLIQSGYVFANGDITSLEIGGSIVAGVSGSNTHSLILSAAIRAGDAIGSLNVKGDIAGNAAASVIVTARGQNSTPGQGEPDVAIGSITVGHRVEQAKFLAGYVATFTPANADAQIGPVKVGGDWIASNLIASAINLGADHTPGGSGANADFNFGDENDQKVGGGGIQDSGARISSIVSITIGGRAMGTPDAQKYGFVAEELGPVKIGGLTIPLHQQGVGGAFRLEGLTNVAVHEISAAFSISTALSSYAERVGTDTVTYRDKDGDLVSVKLSKPLLTDDTIARSVFKFDIGIINDPNITRRVLQEIDLTPLATDDLNITVTVKRGEFGDGLADIGYIDAGSHSVGTVSIPGDLGSIDASGVKSLKVRSLGRFGLLTSGAHTADLQSGVGFTLGSVTVATDVKDAFVSSSGLLLSGHIGSVTIGGSLLGGTVSALSGIGAVKIGGSFAGGNAVATLSGGIGGIGSLSIGGSFLGGVVESAGTVSALTLGPVTIGGNVVGGTAKSTGHIEAGLGKSALKIGGSLLGGSGEASGNIDHGEGGAVTVAHNVRGGAGLTSGSIVGTSFPGITIGGSLIGGGSEAGKITVEGLGAVKIAHNAFGGTGHDSGTVRGKSLASYTLGGSLVGGSGDTAGSVVSEQMGAVKIAHDLAGGSFGLAGVIDVLDDTDTATSVTIGGSLLGGSSGSTGGILSADGLGAVKIGRDFIGGSIGGTTAGFDRSGFIIATGRIGSVTIGGTLAAGFDASTHATGLTANATIRANEDIPALTVTGSILGHSTANGSTPVIITALTHVGAAFEKDVVMGKISVGGLVSFASFDAGYTTAVVGNSGHAQIGTVSVKGNWLTSNVIAGVKNYGPDHTLGGSDDNLNFGDNDDHVIGATMPLSKIASIVIGGIVAGSPGAGDHFGFVAHTIGSFKSAGFTAELEAASNTDRIEISPVTGDVTIHEV